MKCRKKKKVKMVEVSRLSSMNCMVGKWLPNFSTNHLFIFLNSKPYFNFFIGLNCFYLWSEMSIFQEYGRITITINRLKKSGRLLSMMSRGRERAAYHI